MNAHELANGDRMPLLGLGTWKSKPGRVRAAVAEAIRIGYRHVDCAPIYGNEAEVGVGLALAFERGEVERDDVWVTSKLWSDSHAPEHVEPALRRTLEDLRLDRLDLWLVHWPVAFRNGLRYPRRAEDFHAPDDVPLVETWAAMEACVEAGLCRHIGVSNFNVRRLADLLAGCRIPPAVDQVERHPYLQQRDLLEFCRENGVFVTAYSPLGSPDRPAHLLADGEPPLLEDPVVVEVAADRRVTPAQILIRWAVERGTSVIPKSVNPGRIRQNLSAVDLELEEEELRRLDALDRGQRYIDGTFWEIDGGPVTAADLWA